MEDPRRRRRRRVRLVDTVTFTYTELPDGWGLLGQKSFFRFFTVVFRAADFEFDLDPVVA
jgi:hypothetical protein